MSYDPQDDETVGEKLTYIDEAIVELHEALNHVEAAREALDYVSEGGRGGNKMLERVESDLHDTISVLRYRADVLER